MQTRKILIAGAVSLVLIQPALAKKGHDDDSHPGKGWAKGHDRGYDSGPRTKFENSRNHYRYEYSDASCHYRYEYNYRNGKSKVQQRGECRGIAFPRRVVMQGGEPLPRAIPRGAVIGAVVGGAIGKSMEDADHACAAQAMEYAGFKQAVKWRSAQHDTIYTITPVGLLPPAGRGIECRRYSMLTEHGSVKDAVQGTACRQQDGSWRLSS
jgi:surface antigen